MYEYKARKNYRMTDVDIKNQIKFSNVFSKMSKTEKNKQYINLQTNLNSLSKDVRLLIDFSKDKYEKMKSKSSNKDYQYKRFLARSNFLLQKNRNKRFTSILNILNNYINLNQAKLDALAKKKGKFKKNKIKIINKSKEDNLLKKYKINKSSDLNTLPLIKSNVLNKSSEAKEKNIYITEMTTSINNKTNSPKNSSIFLTENNENQDTIPKLHYDEFILPNNNIDINDNSSTKKLTKTINNKSSKNLINRYELIKKTEKIEKLIKENNLKIKNRINYKIAEQNLVDWIIKSKLKFARWKFGIPEIEKYFVDLNAFGKREEQELLKRKTFYDSVEEIIGEIKQKEEERDKQEIMDEYNKDEKNYLNRKDIKVNKEYDENINANDNVMNKHFETSKILKKIKLRKLNEERTRRIINKILEDTELTRKAINSSTDKLFDNKIKKEKSIINNESKDNKPEQKMIIKNSVKEGEPNLNEND
jgi:hypothetical protein